jgi:hypothetical protein
MPYLTDEQYNNMLKNIEKNVPSNCSAYEEIRKRSQINSEVLGTSTFKMSEYEAYRNDIEFVNSFKEQVLIDEKNYFLKKYGDKVYNYLLAQRAEYKEQQRIMRFNTICGPLQTSLSNCQASVASNGACVKEDNTGRNRFLNYLLKKTPVDNPEVIYKKIEYRNEAHELLSTINHWMTILYFVILVVMLGLLSMSQRLFLRERAMLYVFLVVLPFAFPYLFQIVNYIYHYLFPSTPTHGPKNAFLDTESNRDAFNV